MRGRLLLSERRLARIEVEEEGEQRSRQLEVKSTRLDEMLVDLTLDAVAGFLDYNQS